jgi:N-dimethylarginine dimethylaminohydrolase
MNLSDTVNVTKAQEQWNTLKSTIEKAGAEVKVMEPTVSQTSNLLKLSILGSGPVSRFGIHG